MTLIAGIHEAAAAAPPMSPEEYTALRDSIREVGVLVPVVVEKGTKLLVDGRHRWRACQELGVEPPVDWWEPPEDVSPLLWVLAAAAQRRHLNPGQRAILASRYREELRRIRAARGQAGEEKSARHDAEVSVPSENSRRAPDAIEAAQKYGIHPATVSIADDVREFGVPELEERVLEGEVSLRAARAIAERPEPEQRAALARDHAKAAAEARARSQREELERRQRDRDAACRAAADLAASNPRLDLRCVDVELVLPELRDASLVVADPPWSYRNTGSNGAAERQYQGLTMAKVAEHLRLARSAMLPDTYLVLWCTWPLLAEWMAVAPSTGWEYVSGGAWHKTGRIGAGWHWRGDTEPVLLYRQGRPLPVRRDLSNGFAGPRTEHSEKPIEWLTQIIETFCPADGLVFDPYAGLGTTAAACAAAGRRYLGCEIDPERHAKAMERLG